LSAALLPIIFEICMYFDEG